MTLCFRFIFQKLFLSFCAIYSLIFSSFLFFDWLVQRETVWIPTLLDLALVKLELICPLSMLLALVHTLTTLKTHHEILALQSFGVTKKALSAPFFTFCLLFIPISYLNTSLFIPLAKPYLMQEKVDSIDLPSTFLVKQLEDGATIAYQTKNGEIFDLYWIPSTSNIWHAKTITFEGDVVVGHFVDCIIKDGKGCMKKIDSYDSYIFPVALTNPGDHSVSRLADHRYFYTLSCYNIANALLPTLFTTAFLSFFLCYSRTVRPYFSYFIALVAFLLFFSLLKTFIILGNNYVIAPVFSLILLPLTLEVFFLCRLYKI